jgi:hypothetical protein
MGAELCIRVPEKCKSIWSTFANEERVNQNAIRAGSKLNVAQSTNKS